MSGIEAHLPDGTILQFPEGTDPLIMQSSVKKYLGGQAQPAPTPDPTGGRTPTVSGPTAALANGMTFGLADEAAAAGAYTGRNLRNTLTDASTQMRGRMDRAFGVERPAVPDQPPVVTPQQASDATLATERKNLSDFTERNPVTAGTLEMLGGLGATAPAGALGRLVTGTAIPPAASVPSGISGLAQSVGKGAALGGATGAVAGFGNEEGDLTDRLGGAFRGGVGGAAFGAALPLGANVLSGVAGKVGDILGVRNAGNAAMNQILRAFERDGITPNDAAARLQEWQAAGAKPAALFDLGGENVKSLARAAASVPSEARNVAMKMLTERQAGQADRIAGDVAGTLSPNSNFYGTVEGLQAQRRTAAAPLYDKAFAPGSVAPLESQFERALSEASSGRSQAAKDLADAERGMTLAQAQKARAGNDVYASSAALDTERQATSALESARANMAAAENSHSGVLSSLREAQAASDAGLRGGVWSPRVEQFLADPIIKGGIKKGLEIQRLEALAEERPFNPRDYAVTGTDEAGDPIVGKVPNMRLLDAAKRGLDDILEQYRDSTTGRVRLDDRGRAIDAVRRSYIRELDSLNPDYAAARQAWSGPSQSLDALAQGRSIFNKDSEVSAQVIQRMSPGDREFFRAGVVRAIKDAMDSAPDGADAVKRFFSTPAKRAKLEAAFDSPADFLRFQALVNKEAELYKNAQFVSPRAGSHTTRIAQDIEDMGRDPTLGILGNIAQGYAGGRTLGGSVTNAVQNSEFYRRAAQGMSSKTADALAGPLFTPQQTQSTLQQLLAHDLLNRQRFAQRQPLVKGLLGGTGAAVGGLLGSP